jgi:hypothetical protein
MAAKIIYFNKQTAKRLSQFLLILNGIIFQKKRIEKWQQ